MTAALVTTVLLLVCVVGVVLLWPASGGASGGGGDRVGGRGRVGGPGDPGGARRGRHGESGRGSWHARGRWRRGGTEGPPAAAVGATATEVADALTLLGLALRSGCGPVEALEDVSARLEGAVGRQLRAVAAAHRWGLDPDACWRYAPAVWSPAALAWQAALTAGVSPAALVERAADVVRDGESRRVEAALARAGVLLVLPLGACFLPGFVATTVVPVVLHLLHGFAGLP